MLDLDEAVLAYTLTSLSFVKDFTMFTFFCLEDRTLSRTGKGYGGRLTEHWLLVACAGSLPRCVCIFPAFSLHQPDKILLIKLLIVTRATVFTDAPLFFPTTLPIKRNDKMKIKKRSKQSRNPYWSFSTVYF